MSYSLTTTQGLSPANRHFQQIPGAISRSPVRTPSRMSSAQTATTTVQSRSNVQSSTEVARGRNPTGQVAAAFSNTQEVSISDSILIASNGPIHVNSPSNRNPPETNFNNITPTPSQHADHHIYCKHLSDKGRGICLHVPGSNMGLPLAYRKNGVSIGDVGFIHGTGAFAFCFNMFIPANHEINEGRVPIGFIPFDKSKVEKSIEKSVFGGSCLATSCMKLPDSSDFAFKTTGSEGAVLVMPDGAVSEDLLGWKLLESYIAANIGSWQDYLEYERGMPIESGDLQVVIGTDKVSSWGMATFENVDPEQPLRFEFKADGGASQAHNYKWYGIISGRQGPHDEEIRDLVQEGPNPSRLRNQCVFVRTLNVSAIAKVRHELTVSEVRAGRSMDSISDPSQNQLPSGQRNVKPKSGRSFIHLPSLFNLRASQASKSLNKILYQECPNAKVVITKDSDWKSVFTENDTTTFRFEDIHARVLAAYFICEKEGVVTLRKRENIVSTEPRSAVTISRNQNTTSEEAETLDNEKEGYIIGRLFLETPDDRPRTESLGGLNNTVMEKYRSPQADDSGSLCHLSSSSSFFDHSNFYSEEMPEYCYSPDPTLDPPYHLDLGMPSLQSTTIPSLYRQEWNNSDLDNGVPSSFSRSPDSCGKPKHVLPCVKTVKASHVRRRTFKGGASRIDGDHLNPALFSHLDNAFEKNVPENQAFPKMNQRLLTEPPLSLKSTGTLPNRRSPRSRSLTRHPAPDISSRDRDIRVLLARRDSTDIRLFCSYPVPIKSNIHPTHNCSPSVTTRPLGYDACSKRSSPKELRPPKSKNGPVGIEPRNLVQENNAVKCGASENTNLLLWNDLTSPIQPYLDWSPYLPPDVVLDRGSHDSALDTLFPYCTTFDQVDDNWASTFTSDLCWNVGRDFAASLADAYFPLPYIDLALDEMPVAYDNLAQHPNRTAKTFHANAELFVIARDILEVNKCLIKTKTCLNLSTELDDWLASLPPDLQLTAESHSTATSHKLTHHLSYWWLFILLHRPHTSAKAGQQIVHANVCKHAADNIMEIIKTWNDLFGLRFCPVTLIQIGFSAGTLLAMQACSGVGVEKEVDHAITQLKLVAKYLHEIGRSRPGANKIVEILGKLVQKKLTLLLDTHPTLVPARIAQHAHGLS